MTPNGKGRLSTTPWWRIGKWKYSSTHSFTSALRGGEWSASLSGRFTPRERALFTHWIVGWVGPRAGLEMVSKRRIPSLRQGSNPDYLMVQPVASRSSASGSLLKCVDFSSPMRATHPDHLVIKILLKGLWYWEGKLSSFELLRPSSFTTWC